MKLFCLLCAILTVLYSSANATESVIIETKYGKIEGDVVKSTESDFVASVFKGIPYGTAKRFEKPEPLAPWKDTLKTKAFGKKCVVHDIFNEQLFNEQHPDSGELDENCLYLNVFAPNQWKKDTLRPVMIFVHGGGFGVGSSNEYGQNGIVDWLLPKGVLVVTINYRLGPWGFFSTNTTDARGNYGLWDQTLALKWVNENIDRFGGDPKKVTVFGESAGAISCSLLALSPHSRDLFQQVILMSGSSFLPWFGEVDGHNLEASDILSKALGCGSVIKTDKTVPDAKRILECMKKKSTEEIKEKLHKHRPFENFEYVGFVPEIDGDFLPESLSKLYESAPPKPTISGTTADEMGLFVTPAISMDIEWVVKNPETFSMEQFMDKLNHFFPEKKFQKFAPIVRELALNHYVDSIGDRKNNSFLLDQYKKLFSDFFFVYPGFKEAVIRRKRGSTVWLYSFDYYDEAIFPKDFKHRGAQHFLEMPYLFKMDDGLQAHASPWEGNDKKVKDIMTTLWTNFAIYGHPNPENSPYRQEFSWEPINDQFPSQYLHIGLDTEQRPQYERHMVSFWHELLPKIIPMLAELPKSPAETKAAKIEL